MKKLYSLLLAVCLISGIIAPARAVEGDLENPPTEPEATYVEVGTLEELRAAIKDADDGDTIALLQSISINGETLSTGKNITLICADNFSASEMISIAGGEISGLSFVADGADKMLSVPSFSDGTQETVIKDCIFDGSNHATALTAYGTGENHIEISNCEFKNCSNSSIDARTLTEIILNDCYIHDSYDSDVKGAVHSSGNLEINNCVITQNSAFANAGVNCSGTLKISGGTIKENVTRSTQEAVAVDIFCSGVWSITDEEHTGAGYYNVTTGEKISLPVDASNAIAKLIYLTDEEASEYFKPDEPEKPQEPDPELPPVPTPNSPDTPQQPQNPPVSDDDDDDDYTPAAPSKPAETATAPAASTASPLTCGDAAIDTSRSVELAGYGDGLLHEDDPLTRAQLATIIYRLLDDAAIKKYGTDFSPFDDVESGAWCVRSISTLANAGIVAGTSNVSYTPSGLVTWAQALTVLSRFVQPQGITLTNIPYDGWAQAAVKTAVALNWIEDSADFSPDAIISRGELVLLLNRILESYR